MKKKLLALVSALSLCVSLVGCTISSTPAAVGTIGEVEISSGLYLLHQLQAYQTAWAAANSDQTGMSVSEFLRSEIAVDAEGQPNAAANAARVPTETEGASSQAASSAPVAEAEPTLVPVSTYLADETLRGLQYYAAVETRFAALGGQLTPAQLAEADAYAQQMWDSYGALYEANGIGLNTLKAYESNYYKAQTLLGLIYGADGEQPVGEQALTEYLSSGMIYGHYVTVPLYHTESFAFADEEQTAAMLAEAQKAVERFNTLQSEGEGSLLEDFGDALAQTLPAVYEVLGMEYTAADLAGELATDLFSREELAALFNEEALAAVTGLEIGQATAVQYTGYALILFVRADPLADHTLAELQDPLLQAMKGEELTESLYAYGADALTPALDAAAMKKLPAKKIVLE